MKRSDLHPAAYNPRQIDASAQVKLDNGLRKFGMVEPLIHNKRSANLVGGHQRLRLMDQQAGYTEADPSTDYTVYVSVVDLDDTEERTLNVLLNNEGAQGWWNGQQLANMIAADPKINVEDMGFDTGVLRHFLQRSGADLNGLNFDHVWPKESDPSLKQDEETIAAMKATKGDHKAAMGEAGKDGYYLRIVFPSVASKEKFCIACGVNPLNKDVLGVPVAKRLGIDLGIEEPKPEGEPDEAGRPGGGGPADEQAEARGGQ